MKVTFRASFLRDLKAINDEDALRRIQGAIEQVEAAMMGRRPLAVAPKRARGRRP